MDTNTPDHHHPSDSDLEALHRAWMDRPQDPERCRALAQAYARRGQSGSARGDQAAQRSDLNHARYWAEQVLVLQPDDGPARRLLEMLAREQPQEDGWASPAAPAEEKSPADQLPVPETSLPDRASQVPVVRRVGYTVGIGLLSVLFYLLYHYQFVINPFSPHVPEGSTGVYVCRQRGPNHRFHHIGTCWALYNCKWGAEQIAESQAEAEGRIHCRRCSEKWWHRGPAAAGAAGTLGAVWYHFLRRRRRRRQ